MTEKEIFKELELLRNFRDEFTNSVSHELRTPITIIREGTSLLYDKVLGDTNPEQAEMLKDVLEATDRLSAIISDIIEISKLESGKIRMNLEAVNVKTFIQTCVLKHMVAVEKKDLEVFVDMPQEEILVQADNNKIQEVLSKLLENAIFFTENKGKISIRVSEKQDFIEISVADTGTGITSDGIHVIFEKFHQVNRVDGPGKKGTGLGLAIAKKIIDLHEGSIWVESERGRGSIFYFTVPKQIENLRASKKILIVDDEEQIIKVLKMRLEFFGHKVISAANGEECMNKLEEKPDIILLDAIMPGLDGFQVCKQIKALEETKNIPIIMLTALTTEEDIDKSRVCGASYFISKPFDAEDVIIKVNNALDDKH